VLTQTFEVLTKFSDIQNIDSFTKINLFFQHQKLNHIFQETKTIWIKNDLNEIKLIDLNYFEYFIDLFVYAKYNSYQQEITKI